MANREGREFIPAFFVDVVEKGEVFPSGAAHWPLHITLFPPLEAPYYPYYGDKMRSVVNTMAPFDVTLSEDEPVMFGPNEDIPVRLINEAPRLRVIHDALVRTLANLTHDPTYRRPYNPHITIRPDIDLDPGKKIHIGGFSIVEKTVGSNGEIWTVVDKIGLKGIEAAQL